MLTFVILRTLDLPIFSSTQKKSPSFSTEITKYSLLSISKRRSILWFLFTSPFPSTGASEILSLPKGSRLTITVTSRTTWHCPDITKNVQSCSSRMSFTITYKYNLDLFKRCLFVRHCVVSLLCSLPLLSSLFSAGSLCRFSLPVLCVSHLRQLFYRHFQSMLSYFR